MLLAGALGSKARGLAETDADLRWHRTHAPALRLWRATLAERGYVELGDPARRHRALRRIPSLVGAEGTAWMTEDGRRLAVITQDPLVFERPGGNTPDPPPAWVPLGHGWEALEAALSRLERLPRPSSRDPRRRRAANASDPRRLRYY